MNCGMGKMQLLACCANHLAWATNKHFFNALIFSGCPWTSLGFLIYKNASFSQTSIPCSLELNLHALTKTYAKHV
jgi:hypothetical protein